eukprot:364415-Chlamydomonas_euryale.AAC.10
MRRLREGPSGGPPPEPPSFWGVRVCGAEPQLHPQNEGSSGGGGGCDSFGDDEGGDDLEGSGGCDGGGGDGGKHRGGSSAGEPGASPTRTGGGGGGSTVVAPKAAGASAEPSVSSAARGPVSRPTPPQSPARDGRVAAAYEHGALPASTPPLHLHDAPSGGVPPLPPLAAAALSGGTPFAELSAAAAGSARWWRRVRGEWGQHEALLATGAAVVDELRRDVFERLRFTCSAGIAHYKILAKLGSGEVGWPPHQIPHSTTPQRLDRVRWGGHTKPHTKTCTTSHHNARIA